MSYPRWLTAALAGAVLLVAPGAARSAPEQPVLVVVHVRVSGVRGLTDPKDGKPLHGYTLPKCDGSYEVTIETEIACPRCRVVSGHELGHVIGLWHVPEQTSWMNNPSDLAPPLLWPSDPDVSRAAANVRRNTLYLLELDPLLSPPHARSVRWAAATWNAALDRDVFAVR